MEETPRPQSPEQRSGASRRTVTKPVATDRRHSDRRTVPGWKRLLAAIRETTSLPQQ